jgi:hypothetical protein
MMMMFLVLTVMAGEANPNGWVSFWKDRNKRYAYFKILQKKSTSVVQLPPIANHHLVSSDIHNLEKSHSDWHKQQKSISINIPCCLMPIRTLCQIWTRAIV